MLYLEPRLIRDALGERAKSLPFVRRAVSTYPRLLRALLAALDDLERPLEALEMDQVLLGVAQALLALDPSAASGSLGATSARAVEKARNSSTRISSAASPPRNSRR